MGHIEGNKTLSEKKSGGGGEMPNVREMNCTAEAKGEYYA